MAVEAAELFVTVTADVDKATRGLNQVNDATNKSEGFFKGAAKQAVGFAGGLLAFGAAGQAFSLIKGGAIDMNAQLETSTLQFETLMGSSDKARKHVEGLFEFAAKTPFESGPIIEASRLMETFGGSALNSEKNLTTFGNAAAATGNDISEVGFWASRAYADIQAGRPFGEAAARLTEMGVITPQVRSKLEELQKNGAKGPKIWDEFTGAMGRFDGAMDKQAGTFDGMMSTFMDNLNMLLAKALKPLFDGLKSLLGWVNDVMSSDMFNGAMAAAGDAVGKAFSGLSTIVGTLIDALGPIMDVAGPALGDAFTEIKDAIDPLVDAVTGLFDALGSGGDVTEDVAYEMSNLAGALGGIIDTIMDLRNSIVSGILKAVPEASKAFFELLGSLIDIIVELAPVVLGEVINLIGGMLDWVMEEGVPLAAEALLAFANEFAAWIGPALEQLGEVLPVLGAQIIGFIAEYAPKIAGKLVEWAIALLGWVATEVLPKLPGILLHITTVILGWIGSIALILLKEAAKMGMDFVSSIGKELGKLPGKVGDWLASVIAKVLIWVIQMGQKAAQAGQDFLNKLVSFIQQAPGKIMTFLGQLPGMISGWAGKIATAAGNAARDFVSRFINGLASLPGKILQTVRNAFASININVGPFHITGSGVSIDLPKIDIPGFASGSWSVPFTGPALVHQGEMIIPADLANRLRGGQGMGTGQAAGGGGGNTIIINIGDFHGTEDNIRLLSEKLGEQVRYASLRRNG